MFSFLKGSSMAKQLGAETYLECSAFTSEKSIHSVFRTAALACMIKNPPANKPSPVRRLSKRLLHLPSKTELLSSTFSKDKSKSCSIMWILLRSCWGKKKKKESKDEEIDARVCKGKRATISLSFAASSPKPSCEPPRLLRHPLYSTLTLRSWTVTSTPSKRQS